MQKHLKVNNLKNEEIKKLKQYVDDYRQYAWDWIYIANVLEEKKDKKRRD